MSRGRLPDRMKIFPIWNSIPSPLAPVPIVACSLFTETYAIWQIENEAAISKQYADHTPSPGLEESLAAAEGLYWGTGQTSPLTLYQAPFAQHGEVSLTDRSLVEETEI